MASGTPRINPAEHAPGRSGEHHLHHVHTVSAKGHANADFLRSLRDGVRGDAIQTNSGQQQRHNPEQPGKAGHGALLIKSEIHLLLHGPDAGDGQVRINFRQRPGEQRLKRARGRSW